LPPRDFFISKHEDILFVKSHEKIHQGFMNYFLNRNI
jgi:hypothetical protein